MASEARKVSNLDITTTLSSSDRVVVLANPSTAANVKTITASNFANALISSNIFPVANTTQLGLVKIDGNTITISNGVISSTANNYNQNLNTTSNVTFNTINVSTSLTTANITSANSLTINVSNGNHSWVYLANGELKAGGNIIPEANNVYTLGNSSMRWNSLWVGGNSVVFADQNPTYPDQILTVANGVFFIATSSNTSIQSDAGFRVGNFLLQNNYILITNSSANIQIGSTIDTGAINFNRKINVRNATDEWNLLTIDPQGRIDVVSEIATDPSNSAFSITSSRTRAVQQPNNPGVLLQLTGSSTAPARLYHDSYGANNYSAFIGRHARGTSEAPTAVNTGDIIARLGANPYGSDGFASISTTRIDLVVQQDQTASNKGSEIQLWTTANNSNTIAKRLTVNENGLKFPDGAYQNTAFNSNTAVTKINVGTGLTQSANVGIVGIDSTAVLSVTGTTNQVLVSDVGKNITLSLPQNIGTNSNVQFNTITVQNLVVNGNSTIANSASVANAVLHLAYNSTNSAQINTGGFTLGNTSSDYFVSFLYNLSNNSWTTGNTGLITREIVANNISAANGNFDGSLHVGLAYEGYNYPYASIQADCNNNSYNQVVLQNHNSGTQASTDFVAVNDIGDDTSNYIDMGINSSNYANNEYSITAVNDGYLYVNGGDLAVGTQTLNTQIIFFAGGTTLTDKIGSANSSGWYLDHLTVSNTINGTANNTLYVGSTTAANVVSNAQLQSNLANYQTRAGLSANVATLTANLANYIVANTGLVSNSSGVFVNTSYISSISANNASYLGGTAAAAYQLNSTLSANVATLTANSANFIGTLHAANVVSNAQLQANLVNYQTLVGLSANVVTLTSNSANFIGTLSAANVVSNAQLQANLANYTSATQLTANLANYQTTAGLAANVVILTANSANFIGTLSEANVVSNAQLQGNLAFYVTGAGLTANLANYQTTAGLSANVATLTANSANFIGTLSAANVVSNAQLQSNLANYQTRAGLSANVATLTANNASYLGGVAAASYVNTSGSYTISGVYTHNANLVIGSAGGIIANGSIGSNGQYLTSNGSSAYWTYNYPEEQVFILNSNLSLANTTSLQSWFGVGVTLASSTRYRYRLISTVYKSNTLNTVGVQFALGGTAVLARHFYVVNPCDSSTQQTPTTTLQMSDNKTSNFGTAVTITGTNSGSTYYAIIIDGVIDVTTGGTVIPEIGFTGAPGVSSLVQAGSSIEIYPVGSTGSNSSIGSWS